MLQKTQRKRKYGEMVNIFNSYKYLELNFDFQAKAQYQKSGVNPLMPEFISSYYQKKKKKHHLCFSFHKDAELRKVWTKVV